jgi:hypothetical protein
MDRARVDAGLDDTQRADRHVVDCERAGRPLAGRDDAARVAQRAPLGVGVTRGGVGIEPRLERDGVVHERHETQALGLVGEHAVEAGQRQPVDDDDAARRQVGERVPGGAQRGRRRLRKAAVERVGAHGPAERAEPGDDLAVVDVAARRCVEMARKDELYARHGRG